MEKNYDILYLPIAEDDLHSIIDYIMIDDPVNALNLLDKFEKSISKFSRFPHLGAHPKDERLERLNYRILIVESYLIFYVFVNDTVEIRRILSSKRKFGYII
jgi:plasmid stabilization system protein ParE